MVALALAKQPHIAQVVTSPRASWPDPTTVPNWMFFVDETFGLMVRSNGTAWVQVSGLPGASLAEAAFYRSAASEATLLANAILYSTAGGVGLTLQQAASQTADSFNVKNPATAVVARITAAGKIVSQQNSIGYTAPATLVAADLRGSASQLHLTEADSIDGGYVLGLANAIWFTAGAYYNAGWKAAQTAVSGYFSCNVNGIAYYSGAATTVGAAVTLTQRFGVDTTGHAAVGGAAVAGTSLTVWPNAVGDLVFFTRALASQTGNIFEAQNSATAMVFRITTAGLLQWCAANAQTTVGAAGGASALPATPTKYLKVVDSAGTTLVVPAYAAS